MPAALAWLLHSLPPVIQSLRTNTHFPSVSISILNTVTFPAISLNFQNLPSILLSSHYLQELHPLCTLNAHTSSASSICMNFFPEQLAPNFPLGFLPNSSFTLSLPSITRSLPFLFQNFYLFLPLTLIPQLHSLVTFSNAVSSLLLSPFSHLSTLCFSISYYYVTVSNRFSCHCS